jgi:hypothetical protein
MEHGFGRTTLRHSGGATQLFRDGMTRPLPAVWRSSEAALVAPFNSTQVARGGRAASFLSFASQKSPSPFRPQPSRRLSWGISRSQR